MTADSEPLPNAATARASRRTAVREILGIVVVLAVPIGAVAATANPIPNPPSRKTLNIALPERLVVEQQLRKAEKQKRKKTKKVKRRAKNQDQDTGSRQARQRRDRSRASEQRASSP